METDTRHVYQTGSHGNDDTSHIYDDVIDMEFVEPILANPTPAHIPVLRQFAIAALLLVLVFSTAHVSTLMRLFDSPGPSPANTTVEVSPVAPPVVPMENSFTDIALRAKSALVWDVRNQQSLFNKDADVQLPIASIAKIMTALVAYELLADETKVNITIDAIKTDGDSGLTDGESFSLMDITDMVLMASSNDGATALAAAAGSAIEGAVDPEKIFVHAMNVRAAELGLTSTHFKNPTGLDVSELEPGAVSTAREVALLMEYLVTHYPRVAALTTHDETRVYNGAGEYHAVKNTNPIVGEIEGLIASKTGYTSLAGGNLVVAYELGLNRPIVSVVLGSTFNDRFTDTTALIHATKKHIQSTSSSSSQ